MRAPARRTATLPASWSQKRRRRLTRVLFPPPVGPAMPDPTAGDVERQPVDDQRSIRGVAETDPAVRESEGRAWGRRVRGHGLGNRGGASMSSKSRRPLRRFLPLAGSPWAAA